MKTLEDLMMNLERSAAALSKKRANAFSSTDTEEPLAVECLGLLAIAKQHAKNEMEIDFGLDLEESHFYLKVTLRGRALINSTDHNIVSLFSSALMSLALIGIGCFGDEINKAKDICRKSVSDLDSLINSETPEMSQ